jgi:hypothetical protein
MKQPEQSIDTLRETADALSRDPKLMQVLGDACLNPEVHAQALKDPMGLLGSRGMSIPPQFAIEFFEPPSRLDPYFRNWSPFVFELTNCRTVWVREWDGSEYIAPRYKSETLCLGFRLYPNPTN